MTQPDPAQARRSSFLSLLLGMLAALFALGLLILLGGSLLFPFVAVILGIIAVAMFHYLLWGKSLSEQTAGEREEMALNERARDSDATPWTYRR